jgi:PAS domain S-box-containing protein
MPDLPAVLLVDDRPENLVALRAVLEPLRCRMVAVASGEEALKALLQEDFAVVLLDVQMPGMDGFETADLIKGRERTRTVPIIFVTAINTERRHVFRGYSAGAVDYVVKPYEPGVLRSKVAVFLELDAKARAAARSEALLRAAFDAAPIGMARLDLDGRIAEANLALGALLGVSVRELADRPFETLVAPQDAAAVTRARRIVRDGGESHEELGLPDAAGEVIPCDVHLSLARAGAGAPEAVVAQVVDLRERRRAEEERAQRMRERVARVEAERTTERLRAIQHISDAALGHVAFDDLVRELLSRTMEVLGVDTAAVVLHESDEQALIFQAVAGVEGGANTQRRVPADGGAAVTRPLGDAITAARQAPMLVDGQQIGALHVGSLFPRAFTPDDQALLDLAAERAAIGIERARLFQREHGIAEELQRSLLPARLPEVPGFATAARYFAAGAGTQVGGDWYDTVLQPDGRLLVVVGDVAGRGIRAAATMGQLRSALRAYALDGHSPGSLLERLNAFQIGLRNSGMTTVVVVSIDPATGELLYAKAGHPPPLLVDTAGNPSWLDDARGVPLGAVDHATYAEATATLDPGSTLVLYTDGLVEVRGESLDRGFERLQAATIAAPQEIDPLCDAILAGTLAHPAARDDVTLLVVSAAGRRERAGDPFPHRSREAGARPLHNGTWAHAVTRSARVELVSGREASAIARRALDDALAGVASRRELDDVRIAVAELVNNAVVHGGVDGSDRVVMHVAATDDMLRVEVSNPGAGFEIRPPSPREEPGGFGLTIVDRIATRWGVEDDAGTCVWFELDRAGVEGPGP